MNTDLIHNQIPETGSVDGTEFPIHYGVFIKDEEVLIYDVNKAKTNPGTRKSEF